MTNIIRQGDVLLLPIQAMPEGVEAVPLEGKRIVLMHGESTGHAHAIYDYEFPAEIVGKFIRKAQLFALKNGRRFLQVTETVSLQHEEHTTHEIPPGVYELPVQVDMTVDKLPRRVAD